MTPAAHFAFSPNNSTWTVSRKTRHVEYWPGIWTVTAARHLAYTLLIWALRFTSRDQLKDEAAYDQLLDEVISIADDNFCRRSRLNDPPKRRKDYLFAFRRSKAKWAVNFSQMPSTAHTRLSR